MGSAPPDFSVISAELASFGITGITDMSPRNDPEMGRHFAAQMRIGALVQNCLLAGDLSLAAGQPGPWRLGPAKLHLHESVLPDFDEAADFIRIAPRSGARHRDPLRQRGRAGVRAGCDRRRRRIGGRPHRTCVGRFTRTGGTHSIAWLGVCSQPHFVAERGDAYLADVEPRHQGDLYRLRSLIDAGIALVGGSDAPFGSADPWNAMAAAVSRKP